MTDSNFYGNQPCEKLTESKVVSSHFRSFCTFSQSFCTLLNTHWKQKLDHVGEKRLSGYKH